MPPETQPLTPKARRTRSALLAAARTEIAQSGVRAASVMAVCDRAAIGRTSFYNYFTGMDDLVSAVAREAATEIKARFDQSHQHLPRGHKRLAACLRMIFATATQDTDTIQLIEALSHDDPSIMALLENEIAAELAAVCHVGPAQTARLARHLAVTSLALARQLADGRLPPQESEHHINLMLRTCG